MSHGASIKTLHPQAIRSLPIDFHKSRWADSDKGNAQGEEAFRFEPGLLRESTSSLTEQILNSYKTCGSSDERSAWMQKLAGESMRYLARQRGVRLKALKEETIFNQALADLVNRIYDQFVSYTSEFNHALGWNELRVTCTAPALVTEVLRYNKFREAIETTTNFRARLSTRHMSLVIRGKKAAIEFLFLPVEEVIGLSQAEKHYEPVCRLSGTLAEGKVTWNLEDEELSTEHLEKLLMDLFAGLIDRTQQASERND